VGERERWRWLAAIAVEEPDLFRSASSTAMKEVCELVRRSASEDVTVLIRGESGTGKEVTARTIHRLSPRRDGPFVAINCGAIPRDLMEAELFGYERGAFTGALSRKPGRLELAQGGTLLLDEIGDMPRELQVKLLRAIETRSFERLGGGEPVRFDSRLVAATNHDLESAVRRGDFREDLYWRLNVVSIRLPALRERVEDIEPLVNEILVATNARFCRKLYGVTAEALGEMAHYDWPGNVRELRNLIERAFIVERGDRISAASLPFRASAVLPEPTAPSGEPLVTLDEFIARQELAYLRRVMDRVGGNVAQAARILGMARPALHRKLKQLGLRGGED
jgi:transcriptional regulator with PAS, ATPase and Fis domain